MGGTVEPCRVDLGGARRAARHRMVEDRVGLVSHPPGGAHGPAQVAVLLLHELQQEVQPQGAPSELVAQPSEKLRAEVGRIQAVCFRQHPVAVQVRKAVGSRCGINALIAEELLYRERLPDRVAARVGRAFQPREGQQSVARHGKVDVRRPAEGFVLDVCGSQGQLEPAVLHHGVQVGLHRRKARGGRQGDSSELVSRAVAVPRHREEDAVLQESELHSRFQLAAARLRR